MNYQKPDFIEIKMDAEIGSYQNDFDPERDPSFAAPYRASEADEREGGSR
jgi:hypothetical protein